MAFGFNLILLSIVTGIGGGLTPCALGINTILVGALSGKAWATRISQWLLFAVTRAAMLTMLGFLIGLVGQRFGEIAAFYQQMVNVSLMILGVLLIISRFRRLPLPSINLVPASWLEHSQSIVGMGFLFGLDISACISPLLAGVLVQTILVGDWRAGAIALFLFGMALSLPALVVTIVDGADRWLQQVSRRYRKTFYIIVGILMILFGATEFWLTVAFT